MKKNLSFSKTILSILFLAILNFSSKSQSLGLSVSNTTACVSTGTNIITCNLSSTLSGTAFYTFTVSSICGQITFGPWTGTLTSTNVFLTCPGPYTVTCNAVNSSSTIIGTATATGAFNSGSTPTISISPNNGAGCLGTTFTINLSGSSNYTTSGPSIGTQTNTSILVTPSVASCFSVVASNGTCSTNSVRCFTLYSPPSINLSPTLAACSNNANFTISPTGASSYTWNTGSTSPNLIVSSSVSACYTVTGSSPFCSATSSAVTCVNSVPGPTLSVSSSTNAICLGSGGINLSASGACQYTWAISTGSLATIYVYTSNAVFTPTIAGNYYVQVSGICGGCMATSFLTFTVNPPPNVSTSTFSNVSLCSNSGGVSLYAFGATSFSWSNGSFGSTTFVNPTVATCYTVVGSNPGCSSTSSAVSCVTLTPSPTLNITGPSSVCIGSSNIYSVSGASSYTWYAAGPMTIINTGNICNFNSQLYCFVVVGSNSSGCMVTSTVCPFTFPTPTINISSSSNNICSGNFVNISASGATSYTWSNGSNLSSISVAPTSSGCYSVIGSNSSGCYSSAVACVSVQTSPTISITGTSSGCPGTSTTFTSNGALTYTWSTFSNGNTINVSPSSTTCFSVIGSASNGCTGVATKCFTVLPKPNISIAGSNSICIGSSNTFTSSGGSTYTWNTGANTSTINVLPSASTNYTVTASHLLNNCTSTSTVALTVYTNCAIVWPGDANRDGQVDNTDVFELGLASGSTGAARSSTSNAWAGQFASSWTGTVSTGWNKVHADCNGDGTIGAADTVAISNNYSLTHSFKNTSTSSAIDLILSPQNSEVYAGIWNVIDIILGDAGNTQSQIYGAAFDLDYDQNMVENNDVRIVYNTSFLNNNNQNIEFGKTEFNNGKLFAASVRTDHADVSGNGKIAELWFKIKTGFPDNTSFNFGISNGRKTNANGVMGILNTSGAMNLDLNNNATGTAEKLALANTVRFYPNPANNSVTLRNDLNIKTSYRLFDLTGRMILSGEFTSTKNLDVSAINKGIYIIEFETPLNKIQKKLVKE